MTIELSVPDRWSAGHALAIRGLLQQVLNSAHPVVVFIRADATPGQVQDIYDRVEAMIREAGLAA